MAKIPGRSAHVKYVWGNTEFLLPIAGDVFLAGKAAHSSLQIRTAFNLFMPF